MPKLPIFFAKRYLVSKKNYNVINLISYISIAGVSIGSLALFVVLSVYNGFEDFIKGMYHNFDPDLRISLVEGKVFQVDSLMLRHAAEIPGIDAISLGLEETCLLEYENHQTIARMRGVDSLYNRVTDIDSAVYTGFYSPNYLGGQYACLGNGLAFKLDISLDFQHPVHVWMPRRDVDQLGLDAMQAFNQRAILPSGVFMLEPEFDSQYFFVPLEFAQDMLDYPKHSASQIDIRLTHEQFSESAAQQLQQLFGAQYKVLNRYQQREMLYKILQSERWAIFLILLFIIIVASFNILASLTMLIIDKQHDISTLRSLGATQHTIRQIFVLEGWLVTVAGALAGLLLGYILVQIQATFGLIEFPGSGHLLLKAYPVKPLFTDFLLVLGTVAGVGFVATYFPARIIISRLFKNANH